MLRSPLTLVAIALVALAALLATVGAGEAGGALSDWQAFILGVVQGLTEFLPISSSGHLIIVPWLADWHFLEQNPEFNKTFDVALHLGTLAATVVYFRHELWTLLRAGLRSIATRQVRTDEERLAWLVVIASIPAVLIGAAGASVIEEHLGEPWLIAIMLSVFGVLLWIADRRPQEKGLVDLNRRGALTIGFAQAIALIPGVSRSGITITAGRFLRLDRDSAARFSFVLLVPVTAGAVVYKGTTDVLLGDLPTGWQGPFLIGVLAAAGSGLLAIAGLLNYVRRHDYSPFVIYRLIAAAVILLLISTGVREATL